MVLSESGRDALRNWVDAATPDSHPLCMHRPDGPGRKGAPHSPQGRDLRRSWGFWLDVWRLHCGTTGGRSHPARRHCRVSVTPPAQISTIFVSVFIRLCPFTGCGLWISFFLYPRPECRAVAKRSRHKLCIFLVLQIAAKRVRASTRDSVPSRNTAAAASVAG